MSSLVEESWYNKRPMRSRYTSFSPHNNHYAISFSKPSYSRALTAAELLRIRPFDERELEAEARRLSGLHDGEIYSWGYSGADIKAMLDFTEAKRKKLPVLEPPTVEECSHRPKILSHACDAVGRKDRKALRAMSEWQWPSPDTPTRDIPEEPLCPRSKPMEMNPLFDPELVRGAGQRRRNPWKKLSLQAKTRLPCSSGARPATDGSPFSARSPSSHIGATQQGAQPRSSTSEKRPLLHVTSGHSDS